MKLLDMLTVYSIDICALQEFLYYKLISQKEFEDSFFGRDISNDNMKMSENILIEKIF